MTITVGTQLAECDREIELQLRRLQAHEGEPAKGKQRGRTRNAPKFDLRTQLFKMCGVDLTRIDEIDVTKALAVISETGSDLSRFATVGHFTSWLGLCPGTKDSLINKLNKSSRANGIIPIAMELVTFNVNGG